MASLSFKQALSHVKKLFLNLVTSTYISFLPTVEEESAGKSHSLLNSNNHSHITHSHITHTHTHNAHIKNTPENVEQHGTCRFDHFIAEKFLHLYIDL